MVLLVCLVFLERLEMMVCLDLEALRVNLERLALAVMALKVPLDSQAKREIQVLLVYQVLRVHQDHQDCLDQKDKQVYLVCLEALEEREALAPRDALVTEASLEIQAVVA